MADYARLAADAGARIIGGCCGTSHGHLKAMAEALDGYTPRQAIDISDIEARFGPVWQVKLPAEASHGASPNSGRGNRRGRRRQS